MKKIHILLATLLFGLIFVQCTKMPTEVNNPYHGLANTTSIEITKVLRSDTATVLHFDVLLRPSPYAWIRIDSASYLQAEGEKLTVLSAEGLALNEQLKVDKEGIQFTLTFPPLPKEAKSFDFIESDCDNCFKIWDIDLTGKADTYKPDIPAEVLNLKVNKDADLPQPLFKTGTSVVTLYITGLKEGYHLSDPTLAINNSLTQDRDEPKATKEGEGKYTFKANLASTSFANLRVGGKNFSFFLNPEEETEIYLDLTAESKYSAHSNPMKDITYIILKSDLINVNSQLDELRDIQKTLSLIDRDSTIVDLTKEQFLDKLFDTYNRKREEINSNTELSTIQKHYLNNQLKTNIVNMMNNNQFKGVLEMAYRIKNNIKDWRTPIDYKAPQLTEEDLLRLKDINLNDPMWVYSSSFGYAANSFATTNPIELINKVTGQETGLMQDLHKCTPIIKKAANMEVLTPEDEQTLKSASTPYYLEAYKFIYDNAKQAYDEVMLKGGFVIEKTPQAADAKVLDAIVAKYKGKPVFVDFWATWCGPCLGAMKTIKPIKPELAEKGVIIIYVTNPSSPKAKWLNMLPDLGGIHYYLNQAQWKALSDRYDIKGIPTYQIYDKNGKNVKQFTGYPGNDKVKEELAKVW